VVDRKKSALLIVWLGLLIATPALPAFADGEDGYSEKYFEDHFDFLAILKFTKLTNYLNYKGASLSPVGNSAVTCDFHPQSNVTSEKAVRVTEKYEDLWYHNDLPIGCRRYRDMHVESSGSGCIRLISTPDAGDMPGALANAAVRLLLDINLHGCYCNTIIVPKEILGDVFNGFSRLGFSEVQSRPESGIPGHIIVDIDSDPPGLQKRVFYRDQNW
jgi:hypothetical protein